MSDGNDLLMGGGVKAAEFKNLGDTVIGTVLDPPKQVQETKFKSTELDFWPSGDPKMKVVVNIQTDLRDPANALDDGRRVLHIHPRMMQPVREAVLRASAPGLEVGGRIAVRWVSGTGEGEGNARQFAAEYARPVLDAASLMGGQPIAQPAPLIQTAPAVQTAPMLSAPAAPVGQTDLFSAPAGAAKPASIDQVVWDRLDPVQKNAVAAAAMATAMGANAPF